MKNQATIHCNNCDGQGKKKSTIKTHTKYRCNQCKLVVNSQTRICKNHVNVGSYSIFHPEQVIDRSCRICDGTGNVTRVSKELEKDQLITDEGEANSGMIKAIDSLHRTIKFDRKLYQAVRQFNRSTSGSPHKLIKTVISHLERYNPKEAISAFRQAMMPEEMARSIADTTDCDKWVEKTHLSNTIMWTLSLFLQHKTEDFAIQQIADASASLLGREFSSHGRAVDNNTVGKRLEKPELVKALELMLQGCSAQLGNSTFETPGSLVNIYYDWFYLVKSGNQWQICQDVGRTKDSKGIKIGIGIEWDTKAVVSLVMHGQHHRNDVVSFKKDLMVRSRSGIVHITDSGPSDSKTMQEIRELQQHFIIKLRKNLKTQLVHQIFLGSHEFRLDTPSNTRIRLLEEKLIRLHANPDLGDIKYIRFQYNCLRTGKFKTVVLISSLPLSAEQIIQAHAWRWVATETEFNILQHQFGLEKIYIKKPEKAWPLLLLALCGKMLLELTFQAVHMVHGSKEIISLQKMQTAPFTRSFTKFLNAVLMGIDNPLDLIEPCQEPYCCFRNNHGQRLR